MQRKDFRTPLAVDNSEMLVIGLSLKWRQICFCPLTDHASRPMKSQNELWLLYNLKKSCETKAFLKSINGMKRVESTVQGTPPPVAGQGFQNRGRCFIRHKIKFNLHC